MYLARLKVAPKILLIFQELSRDVTLNFRHWLLIQLFANLESFSTLSTELTNTLLFVMAT